MHLIRVTIILCFVHIMVIGADEYIPDSTIEPISINAKDNDFSWHVAIETINNVPKFNAPPVDSPKKYYSFALDETFDQKTGFSTQLIITSHLVNRNTKLSFTDHLGGGVRAKWINDKYLMASIWIGRIACVQFIFDCQNGTVITCDIERYNGELHRQQKDASDALIKTKE